MLAKHIEELHGALKCSVPIIFRYNRYADVIHTPCVYVLATLALVVVPWCVEELVLLDQEHIINFSSI